VADLTGADLGSLRPGDGSALAHAIGRVAREAAAPGQVSAGFESSM
jgi:FXSXX-COOH protein